MRRGPRCFHLAGALVLSVLAASCGGGAGEPSRKIGPRHTLDLRSASGTASGLVVLHLTMEKLWPHPLPFSLEYSTDGGETYLPATFDADADYITLKDGGHRHRLSWDSRADLGSGLHSARLRVSTDLPARFSNTVDLSVANEELLAAGEAMALARGDGDLLVLEIGDLESFSAGHVERAILIGAKEDVPPPTAEALLVIGPREGDDAGRMAREALLGGWKRAAVLAGGSAAWADAGGYLVVEEFLAAKELLQTGAVPVDVRSPEDFAGGHIPGAMPVPTAGTPVPIISPDDVLLVYGEGLEGDGSVEAALLLERLGFRGVRRLRFGMAGWIRAGGETE